jgi:hypothetical protein
MQTYGAEPIQDLAIPESTYLILTEILQSPSISAWQLHNLRLKSLLCCITANRLAPCPRCRLIICADPTGHALIRHFSGNISIYARYKLVV